MNENENTLFKFYTAFANADAETMCKCYHPDIQFRDPIFELVKGSAVCDMWKMIIQKSEGKIKIDFNEIKATEFIGSARWIATFDFSTTNRRVINIIKAEFHFKDGLIIKHTDNFDLWKWSKQALGLQGYLFGWTGFFQTKINEQAILSLKKYKENDDAY